MKFQGSFTVSVEWIIMVGKGVRREEENTCVSQFFSFGGRMEKVTNCDQLPVS